MYDAWLPAVNTVGYVYIWPVGLAGNALRSNNASASMEAPRSSASAATASMEATESACKGAGAERSSCWPAAPFTQLQGRESTRPSFHLAIHYPRSTTGWTSQMSSPFGAFAFSQFQSQLGASPCLLSSKYVLIVQIGITWKTNKLIKVPTYLTLYSNLCVNWKHYLSSMNI